MTVTEIISKCLEDSTEELRRQNRKLADQVGELTLERDSLNAAVERARKTHEELTAERDRNGDQCFQASRTIRQLREQLAELKDSPLKDIRQITIEYADGRAAVLVKPD